MSISDTVGCVKGGDKEMKAKPQVQDPKFINVPEAAELTRLSEVSIRRYLTRKLLTRYKVFGRTLLKRDEVMALIRKA